MLDKIIEVIDTLALFTLMIIVGVAILIAARNSVVIAVGVVVIMTLVIGSIESDY